MTELKENINIVFAIDNNYVQQCAVTLISILMNSQTEVGFTFYILNTDLTIKNKDKLTSLKHLRDFNIEFIDVSNYDCSQFPLNRDHISIATYYRLFLTEVLPETIDKCIYMDCDMIAEDDIHKLWSFDISDSIAGVVEDENSKCNLERLNLPLENNYFNAGMLVLNLKKLRTFNLKEKSIEYYNKNKELITLQDQDILNGIFNGKCKFLPLNWNVNTPAYMKELTKHLYSTQDEENALQNPGIIHFTGEYKPWQNTCSHPLTKEYEKYLLCSKLKKDINIYNFKKFVSKIYCRKISWNVQKVYILGILVYKKVRGDLNLLQKIFSIKNEVKNNTKYKYLTILGIKFQI